jgi:hypothetical protein
VSEELEKKSNGGSLLSSDLRHALVVGTFMVIAAVLHACISGGSASATPLHVGTILGDVHVRSSPTSVSHHKLGGCRIECFESFVVVYIDKEKQPTWTGNYVKTIPWSKIEYITLADPNAG